MRKTIILSVILVVCAIVAALFIWRNDKGPSESLQLIPDQPVFIIEGNGAGWPTILPNDSANYQGSFPMLDSIQMDLEHMISWIRGFSKLQQATDQPVLLAGYSNGSPHCDLLMVIPIVSGKKTHPETDIPGLDSIAPVINERLIQKEHILDVTFPGTEKLYSLCRLGDYIVLSTSSFLTESAVISLKGETSLGSNGNFLKARKAMENVTGTHFYVSIPQLATFMSSADLHVFPGVNDQLKTIAQWVAFSVTPASAAMLIDGYVVANDSTDVLSRYTQFGSANSRLTDVLPASTMFYHESTPAQEPGKFLAGATAQKEYEEVWRNWAGTSWARVANFKVSDGIQLKQAFLIQTDKPEEAMNRLTALSDSSLMQYKSVTYGHMKPSEVLRELGGLSTGVYYAAIGDYLLFAPTIVQLKSYIDAALSKRTWAEKSIAKAADSILLSSWSQLFYMDLDALNNIQFQTDQTERGLIDTWSPLIIQLNPHNGMYILNGYLMRNNGGDEPEAAGWITESDASIIAGPFVLNNQITGNDGIVFQDSLSQLYLLDVNGEIIWKRTLNAPVIGDISMVDFYKNRKYQMLFSTADAIYLIDMKGNDVEGFPIRLSSNIVAGVSAIDYERNGEYRMFVGCENGSIYGFYKNGKPLTGWKPLKGMQMAGSMEHFLSAGKDFLYYVSTDNRLVAKNRKGENRFNPIELPEDLLHGLVPDKKRDPDYLIALKSNGQLFRIDKGGSTALLSFASEPHSAAIGDLDGDGVVEIVYANALGIFATTLKGETLYTFDPGDPLSYEVSLLGSGKKKQVVLTSHLTGNTFLLDPAGNPSDEEPFQTAGKTAWVDDPVKLFLVANGRLLQSFVIE